MTTLTPGRYSVATEVEVLNAEGQYLVKVRNAKSDQIKYMHMDGYTFTRLADPEPPRNSVVIDSDGDAWQKQGDDDGWFLAGSGQNSTYYDLSWAQLSKNHGPVKVVYTP